MTATSRYHSNKQPPLVAMATHHNTWRLKDGHIWRSTNQNNFLKKFFMKPQTTYRSTDKCYIFWSLSQYHLQVLIATTPGRHENYLTLLWQSHQVPRKMHPIAMKNSPVCHSNSTKLLYQPHPETMTTIPGYFITLTTTPSYYDSHIWIP
jgi:hypothetical protein